MPVPVAATRAGSAGGSVDHMPGMGHGLQTDNPTIAAAFRTALDHQFLIILVILVAVLAVAWNVVRTIHYRRAVAAGTLDATVPDALALPRAGGPPAPPDHLRHPVGVRRAAPGAERRCRSACPARSSRPSASSSPGWVQHLVNVGTTIWSDHPVTAAAATVWIQVGIGVFLLVAPRGYWSRAAGG